MKYKVEQNEGCLSYGLKVNGKDWSGEYAPTLMSEQEKEEFVNYLLQEYKKQLKENSVTIDSLISVFQYDSWEEKNTCDTCGDRVSTTTWLFD